MGSRTITILTIAAALFCPHTLSRSTPADNFFSQADAFLKRYVDGGLVDYQGIRKETEALERLITGISDGGTLRLESRDDSLAFYINAYNLLVINAILRHFPVRSPMDVPGFFDRNQHTVLGEELTLNQLENQKIRALFKDPRIHFVLVCAALGCPPLFSGAFTPDNVEELLEKRTRETLNNADFLRRKDRSNAVEISKIFDWYRQDFETGEKNLRDFLNSYLSHKIPAQFELVFYEYDWTLNGK